MQTARTWSLYLTEQDTKSVSQRLLCEAPVSMFLQGYTIIQAMMRYQN